MAGVKTLAVMLTVTVLFAIATILFFRNGGMQSDREDAMRRYADTSSKFTTLAGVSFHYRDEGTGPPLVLLHGSRASLQQWDGWVTELRDHFRVIRIDAMAHGLTSSGTPGDYAPARGTELLRLLVDELGLTSFHLGGTSAGSSAAVRFAAAHPERVLKLILSTVPLRLPPSVDMPLPRRAVFWIHHRVLRSTATNTYWRHFLEGIYADPGKVTAATVERYRILNSFPGREEEQRQLISAWYQAGGPDRDYELAGQVEAPVLIQWGAAGPVLPQHLQCAVADAFSNTTVRAISYADLGHKLIMEDAPRTVRDAQRFLNGESVGSVCDRNAPFPEPSSR